MVHSVLLGVHCKGYTWNVQYKVYIPDTVYRVHSIQKLSLIKLESCKVHTKPEKMNLKQLSRLLYYFVCQRYLYTLQILQYK